MKTTFDEISKQFKDISFPMAVAVSGGPDSLCLLFLAHKWASENNGKVVGLTVDHGLRSESKQEALKVHKLLQKHGIEHHILSWEEDKPKTRIQEKARSARYNLLINWCKLNNVQSLLLGHHRQDQEETFWMRLTCGSGLDGLSGIKEKSVKGGVTLIRPLLRVSKEQILQTLAENKLPWIQDPTNENPAFFRGRFRSFIEKEGLNQDRLIKVIAKLNRDADFIHQSLLTMVASVVKLHDEGYITLEKNAFDDLHPALSQRLVSYLMVWFSGSHYTPRHEKVLGILEKLKSQSKFTAGGVMWIIKERFILLIREQAKIENHVFLNSLESDILWDQRFFIKSDIQNVLKKKSFLAPLGHQPQLKKEVNTQIPSSVWPTLPSIWCEGSVVSVPHLCYSSCSDLDYRKFFTLKPIFYDSR